ncbi:two-component response regulator [[Clostridium] ultunense Esp]|uniref:response regulator n=1 Tax=Thermicanus aegyptius TaxID=94009 RepID=UPI0002B6F36A|nr:response regulator [Thermicanus aegyptius]CCQ95006.1 two-component response regulator [[Clostridium] ultunense Esp]
MKKVLIVDDQLGIRMLLTELLKKDGYETQQAANGREALALLGKESFHLILLDMKIPGMNGIEILREIRQRLPSIQVMMMTAYGELEMMEEARNLGVLHYFAKPFDVEEIRHEVNKVLRDVV